MKRYLPHILGAILLVSPLMGAQAYEAEYDYGENMVDPQDLDLEDLSILQLNDAEIIDVLKVVDVNEITASEEALKRRLNPVVLKYAGFMHQVHGQHLALTNQLASLMPIESESSLLARALKTQSAASLRIMKLLNDKLFEKAYINQMVMEHKQVLKLIEHKLLKDVKNEMLKAHLEKTYEHVAQHLRMARAIRASL